MSPADLINPLVAITLVELMLAIGLAASPGDVFRVARDPRLLARAVAANYVVVPAIAVLMLLNLRPDPLVAAGFLIAAVCPGAPYGPPFTTAAKGNNAVAVGLMIVLAASSAVVAPLLLKLCLPLVAGSGDVGFDVARMIVTLFVVQLLPLCIGLLTRQKLPRLADRIVWPATYLSGVLNFALIVLIVVVHFPTLATLRPQGYGGMTILVLAAVAAGWLLGTPGAENRRAMAITTAIRNVGVALVIATGSFPDTPAVSATVAFAIFQTALMAVVATLWGRLPIAPKSSAGPE